MNPAWWHRPAFWAALPVTAVQGLWLRRRALRLPGASGERRGTLGSGPELEFLALGDSIIDGVGAGVMAVSLPVRFAAALADDANATVNWRVEGRSGHAIADVIARLESLEDSAPADVVLLSVGVNDVTGLTSTRCWRRSLERLFDLLRERWPNARILFAGLPPMGLFPLPPQPLRFSLGLRAATLDGIAADVAQRYAGAVHVPTRIDPLHHDFCADGFHPSPESCTLWAEELSAELSREWTASTNRSASG